MYAILVGPKYMISGEKIMPDSTLGVRNVLLASIENMDETANFLVS